VARIEIPIVVQDAAGNAVQGAQVQVFIRGGALATIYAAQAGGAVLGNPLATDAGGRVTGWLERGDYDCIVSAAGLASYTEGIDAAPAAQGSIDSGWLGDDSVQAQHVAPGAITSLALAPGAALANLAADSIPVGLLAPDSVGDSELIDGSVGVAHLAASLNYLKTPPTVVYVAGAIGNGGSYQIVAPVAATYVIGWGAGAFNGGSQGSGGLITCNRAAGAAQGGDVGGDGGAVFNTWVAAAGQLTATFSLNNSGGSSFSHLWALLLRIA
jgi:hypothetical protein